MPLGTALASLLIGSCVDCRRGPATTQGRCAVCHAMATIPWREEKAATIRFKTKALTKLKADSLVKKPKEALPTRFDLIGDDQW